MPQYGVNGHSNSWTKCALGVSIPQKGGQVKSMCSLTIPFASVWQKKIGQSTSMRAQALFPGHKVSARQQYCHPQDKGCDINKTGAAKCHSAPKYLADAGEISVYPK